MLITSVLSVDGDVYMFVGASPDGLSLFGLVGMTAETAPAKGTNWTLAAMVIAAFVIVVGGGFALWRKGGAKAK